MSIEFKNASYGPLKDFRAVAPPGAIIGVIGEKGSGVTEVLKLACGILKPEQGEVKTSSDARFVGGGEALNVAPAAVLALDQTLATQDAVVRARTLTALDRLRRAGSTVLLASHEERLLEALCDEVWWIEAGEMAAKGDPGETLRKYRRAVAGKIRAWGATIQPRLTPSYRRGDGRAEVLAIDTLGADGKPTIVWKSGEMVSVRIAVKFHEEVQDPVLGILIRTQIGFEVYGTNTELERLKLGPRAAGDTVTLSFRFLCDLCPHPYTLTVASHDPDGTAHDWLEDAVAFTVTDDRYTAGVANLRAKVEIV